MKTLINVYGPFETLGPKKEQTYNIPEENWVELEKKIAKLNRSATKLGCDEIKIQVIREYEVENKDAYGVISYASYREIYVTGHAPKFAGWTFIAKLEPLENKHIIRAVPGKTVPEEYREFNHYCEHCNTARYRKLYYLVQHDNGKYKKVGSTCLKDFLGHKSPTAIASWMQTISEILNGEGFEGGFGGGYTEYAITSILAVAERLMRNNGYVKHDSETQASTKDQVNYYLDPGYTGEEKREQAAFKEKYPLDEKAKETAEKALNWMKEFEHSSNDYLYNLFVVCTMQKSVNWRKIGLVTSGMWAYLKEVEKREFEKKERKNKTNEFVGTIGKREIFDLTFVKSRWFHSGYNENGTYLLQFEDATGNMFIWFTSAVYEDDDNDLSWKDIKLEKGKSLKVKGTVKDHKLYNERKQTVLQRLFPAK